MNLMTILLFIAGLAVLTIGAEWLVRGASRLAAAVGVSPLVIGLTVVAFGTSSPELAVSVKAALAGQANIGVGNVVGSNIFNILLILGVSALITPLAVHQRLVRLDVPLMIGISIFVYLISLDGKLSRLEGALLLAGIVSYIVFLIRQSRRESQQIKEEYAQEFGEAQSEEGHWAVQVGLVIIGLTALVVGSNWLVDSAAAMAKALGVSDLIIGLTIVAAGTSLPEVATSVMAAIRDERDIAVGNVVGSNIYNLLAILGAASVVAPDGVAVAPAALHFDMPVMIAVAVACLPIFFTGHAIARWEGALFLGYYIAYTLYLILGAMQHAMLPTFNRIMMVFVVPLTAVTLLILAARALHQQHRKPSTE
ncbi:MAG: calcium/sodium antiporter [Acidobacteriota bacterium]|nr:calcium/sodium antiporter [Blastocatellia bacterium]MDW8238999.1 calcium/sodium antiporter [Acidobacteriota bacterium]